VVIRFFSSLRSITGEKQLEWGAPPATLGDLLRLLSERYGPEFRGWVLQGEALGGSVLVVVNGQDVRHGAGLATPLRHTDVVSLLPIMAGGRHPSALGCAAVGRQMTRRPAPGVQHGAV
jgi:MoaD family protein